MVQKRGSFKDRSKTLFIWEGVSQYISKQANDSTMKCASQAATGSKFVFSYIVKSFIDGKNIHDGIKTMYKKMRKKNNPLWIYGLDPDDIGDYLSNYSLSLIEDIGSEEMEERYMKLVNLGLSIFEEERMVLAKIKS